MEIERSFRTIKSFLDIRPVGHSKSKRIKVHVFVCVLSLLLSKIIEKRTNATVSHVADILSELKAIPVRFPGGKLILRSESENADRMLSLLSIPVPKKVLGNTLTEQE